MNKQEESTESYRVFCITFDARLNCPIRRLVFEHVQQAVAAAKLEELEADRPAGVTYELKLHRADALIGGPPGRRSHGAPGRGRPAAKDAGGEEAEDPGIDPPEEMAADDVEPAEVPA